MGILEGATSGRVATAFPRPCRSARACDTWVTGPYPGPLRPVSGGRGYAPRSPATSSTNAATTSAPKP